MKGSAVLLVVAATLLGGVAWFAWAGPDTGADLEPQRLPSEAPAIPVELPDPRPAPLPPPEPGGSPSWTKLNDEGIQALEDGDLEAAIAAFEACHEGDPGEEVYARNLAEALARQAVALHDSASEEVRLIAIAMLQRATSLDPERDKLVELLERWKRSAAAEEGFFVDRELHFEVAYDLDRSEVRVEIDQVKDLLEAAYLEFGEHFGVWPVERSAKAGDPSKIRVVLYTREGFDRVTGIGPWAGGVYDGTIRVPVGDLSRELPRVRRVLRHELLHAFVQEVGGSKVPAWLNEGLAQWLESTSASARAHEVEAARAKLEDQELFDLDSLGGSLASWTDQGAIERAYAEALALVAWIASEHGERVLYDLVGRCGEGVAVGVAFEAMVHVPLETVFEDLRQDL